MSKNEILEIMYEYSLEKGLCKNKKAFAMFIGISPTNYSKVFADTTERFCSLNVLLKANTALGSVFSAQWLVDGTGEMYANNNVPAPAPAPAQTPTHVHARGIRPSFDDDDIEYLRHRIQELEYVIELQRHRIEQLEKGHASARAN